MPELPEVETVRRGLAPAMEGAVFLAVVTRRRDLRFPFPQDFCERLTGSRVQRLDRRGKYLFADLSTGERLIMHLGMSGRFTVRSAAGAARPGVFHHDRSSAAVHDHVTFWMQGPNGRFVIDYNDPRRFGFMDVEGGASHGQSGRFAAMGPEPLGPDFTPDGFIEAVRGKTAPIKAALLDQSVVAGLGNIYVCEALFRAGISPRRKAGAVGREKALRLHSAIRDVLAEAIEAGGSTLRDFAASDGSLGYFQHRFSVYDREGSDCPVCGGEIRRITQSGRSTFYCGACQR